MGMFPQTGRATSITPAHQTAKRLVQIKKFSSFLCVVSRRERNSPTTTAMNILRILSNRRVAVARSALFLINRQSSSPTIASSLFLTKKIAVVEWLWLAWPTITRSAYVAKMYCECKKRIKVPKRNRKKKWVGPPDRNHNICRKCWRSLRDSIRSVRKP